MRGSGLPTSDRRNTVTKPDGCAISNPHAETDAEAETLALTNSDGRSQPLTPAPNPAK